MLRKLFLAALFALGLSPALAGTLYIDTGGSATNSCSRDAASAALSGTGDAVVTGSVVQLTIPTDLSSVVTTAGATQDTIYIAQASNANTKVFWITAKDDGADQVTVSVAPTGVTASNWAIGGQCILTNASQEGALRAGDTAIFNNSPASQAATSWTFRIAGDATSGRATIKGKTGVRPVLTTSGSGNPTVNVNSLAVTKVENLEIQQTHASAGNGITINAANSLIYNVKVSDAGAVGIAVTASSLARIISSEVSGAVTDGIAAAANIVLVGSYIHDNGQDGVELSNTDPSSIIGNSISESNGARGIYFSGASTVGSGLAQVSQTTVYDNGNSGIEVLDADTGLIITNTIAMNNGDAASEYNAEWVAGAAEIYGFHAWNIFNTDAAGGSDNVSGLTLNAQVAASEPTTDPLFTNAAGGNFAIGLTSPAKASGYPGAFISGSTGYLDMGAVQRLEPIEGGGGSSGHVVQ